VSATESDWFSHPRFATQLEARVVDTSGEEPRIHGFGVRSDLARHFSFADVIALSLTGVEPSERASDALRRALVVLSPTDVGSAPAHLGVLVHLVSRDYASSVASASALLAERAAATLAERAELLQALREGREPAATASQLEAANAEGEEVAGLFAQCSDFAQTPWFARLDATSAALVVLFECGLVENWQLQSALFLAWCPCTMAELGTRGSDPIESYPINLPKFRYE
jgi:hypothetical protein